MKLAIVGTVGVPGNYGGFETLAQNLLRYQLDEALPVTTDVYCSAKAYPDRPPRFLGARLLYVPLDANGVQSIAYDSWSLFAAALRRTDVILLLGVSGAIALPALRLVSNARVITNIDGMEWRRQKWTGFARRFLRWSEYLAVRFSHHVIADNEAIADYVRQTYGRSVQTIAYGGDHALASEAAGTPPDGLPPEYDLALCRIEPENNVETILRAYRDCPTRQLVFVGNWQASAFGQDMHERFADAPNIHLSDPVYHPGKLRAIRERATLYIHGHSAGGTNPSLVEMMHFGKPVLAFDCVFNRYSTEQNCLYFKDNLDLSALLGHAEPRQLSAIGAKLLAVANRRYRWDSIGRAYFNLVSRARWEHRYATSYSQEKLTSVPLSNSEESA